MGRGATNCSQGACTITVKVTGCSGTQIMPSIEPVWVDPGYAGPMHWKLDAPPGWKFAQPGIVIQNGSSESLARILVAVFTIGIIGFLLDRIMLALQAAVTHSANR